MSIPTSHLMLSALLTLTLTGCLGGGGDGGDGTPDPGTSDPVLECPFTFELPEDTFDEPGSPALVTFPIFGDGELEQVGEDGQSVQLIASSIQPFLASDGRQDRSPAITLIQNTKGPSALLTPDEVSAETDRLEEAARVTLDAVTARDTVEFGGQTVDVLIASADASIVATVFVPIDAGAFFAPVSLGVYTGRDGCQTTMELTFQAVLAGIAPNTDSTFDTLQAVIDLKVEKGN